MKVQEVELRVENEEVGLQVEEKPQREEAWRHVEGVRLLEKEVWQHVEGARLLEEKVWQHVEGARLLEEKAWQHVEGARLPEEKAGQHVEGARLLEEKAWQHIEGAQRLEEKAWLPAEEVDAWMRVMVQEAQMGLRVRLQLQIGEGRSRTGRSVQQRLGRLLDQQSCIKQLDLLNTCCPNCTIDLCTASKPVRSNAGHC